jgi:hypothetical protein
MSFPVSRSAQFALIFSLVSLGSAHCEINPAPTLTTQALNNDVRVTLRGNTHPLARPEFDRGVAPDSQSIRRMLVLLRRSPEQQAALSELLTEQQVKSSPNYHRWLTPEQFGERFGASDEDIQAVTGWLASQGFGVGKVSAGRTVIEFSGTAGQVRSALRTEIHKYLVDGQERWANASDPQIPATLARVVQGIVSLNNFPRRPMHRTVGAFRRRKATGLVEPLYTYPSGTATFYTLGPTDFATIYNVLPLWQAGIDGTGQTIAIVGDSNIKTQDVDDFRAMFGLPPNPVTVILDGPDPGTYLEDEIEADLDVEWAGAIAKNATIDLVVAETTEATAGTDLATLYAIDNNIASVLSDSFGECEQQLGNAGNAFESAMAEQAAAQGITVVVSSGDSGSAGCDSSGSESAANGLAVNGLASTPFNVAVGGTEFGNPAAYFNTTNDPTTGASVKSYVPEVAWNESCASSGNPADCSAVSTTPTSVIAGGGGPSNCAVQDSTGNCVSGYPKPEWQTGTGVPSDGLRDIPDVSLFAGNGQDYTFYIACITQVEPCSLGGREEDFFGVSGTSVTAPAFAGIVALAVQKTGQRQGIANYILYAMAAATAASSSYCTSNAAAVGNTSCVFYDTTMGLNAALAEITPGNNSVNCEGGSPNCSSTVAGSYGIMVDPNSPSTPAWTTSTGYDMATGLGSVNAANLVNNWSSISFWPSATTLNLSPAAITHGQSLNVNVQVTSAGGTPSGDVALMGTPTTAVNPQAGKSIGIADFALGSGGTASGTTNMLAGGTYNVFAHYAGNGTTGASDSAPPVTVTVNPESSETGLQIVALNTATGQLSYGATSLLFGSPYVLRVDVRNAAGAQCAPMNPSGTQTQPTSSCPTGTVIWTDNGGPPSSEYPSSEYPNPPADSTPGSLTLNNQGYAEDQFVQLSAGTHTLVATYSGDNSFGASTSAPVTVNVASFYLSANPSTLSAPAGHQASYTISATGLGGFSGMVQFTCVVSAAMPLAGYMPTCSFNPASVTVGPSPGSTTLNVNTIGPALFFPRNRDPRGLNLFIVTIGLGLTLILAAGAFPARSRRLLRSALFAGLVFLSPVAFVACGGGGHSPGARTPAGDYTITVTGTFGTLFPQTQVVLTVQ